MQSVTTWSAVLASTFAVALGSTGAAAAPNRAAGGRQLAKADGLVRRIAHYRSETWRWQQLMGVPITHATFSELASPDDSYRSWVLRLWQRRAGDAARRAQDPPHEGAWLCIHRYEGSWSDAGSPYYGGLQMDLGFQDRYGGFLLHRKGTANNWTPLEQMWVAERAFRSGRGFWPWPNTARYCGLL